jgi:hypothetical protein
LSLGLLYTEGESLSESRLNAKSIFSGSGAEITSLPSTKQVPIARCISTSDGFEADELYFQSSDGTSYLNVRRKHLHNAETDVAGGELNNILIANPKQIYTNLAAVSINDFRNYKHANAPAIANVAAPSDANYFTVQTGTASGEYNNVFRGGIQLGFAKSVYIQMKMQLSHNSGLVFRAGAGMEWVQNSTANSNKLGLEGCAGTGTVFQVVTGNSLGRTATPTDSNMAPSPAQLRGYKLYWNPITADVNYEDSDGNVKNVTATLPSSGAVVSSSLFRLGINTTNTTANTVSFAGLLLIGQHQDSVLPF